MVFKENGNIINNPDRPFIQDLDKLNYPAREILDLKKYQRHARPHFDVYPVDIVVSSRGCPFACTHEYKIPLFIREYIKRYDKLYGKLHKWAKDKNVR